MRLDTLREGQCALVLRVQAAEAMRRRLCDFGLIEGTKIFCIRRDRSASIFLVRGTMIALRRADLAKIGVSLCG